MTGSAVPAVIDALVEALTDALPDASVFDGPGLTEDAPGLVVHVGWSDPDQEQFDEAAVSEQAWPWLGHSARRETFRVHCVAIAWNGNSDMKAARDAAYEAVTAAAEAIQDDPSLGGSATYTVGLTTSSLFQILDNKGACARLPFDVECSVTLS